MLILERKENEVYFEGRKLTIVAQATKGPNQEVVKIEGLPQSNGQKWISLRKLHEGLNEVECQAKEVTSYKKYELTNEEAQTIKSLQAQIDAIIEEAKKRYVPKSKKLEDMSIEELEAYIAARKA